MLISDYLSFDLTHFRQNYFRSFFGSNKNFKICFRDYLAFNMYVFVFSLLVSCISWFFSIRQTSSSFENESQQS